MAAPPAIAVERFRVEHGEGFTMPVVSLTDRRAAGKPTAYAAAHDHAGEKNHGHIHAVKRPYRCRAGSRGCFAVAFNR